VANFHIVRGSGGSDRDSFGTEFQHARHYQHFVAAEVSNHETGMTRLDDRTSTSCRMATTSTSYSEFLQPTSTPGFKPVGASEGQNIRIKALLAGISTCRLERASAFQLLARRNPSRSGARVLHLESALFLPHLLNFTYYFRLLLGDALYRNDE
jgi:hypothetical protein